MIICGVTVLSCHIAPLQNSTLYFFLKIDRTASFCIQSQVPDLPKALEILEVGDLATLRES